MTNSARRQGADVLESKTRRPVSKGRPTPRQRPRTPPGRRPVPRRALIAGSVVVVALLATAGVVLARRGSDGPPVAGEPVPTTSATPAAAQVWRDAAVADLRPLTGLVVNLGQGVNAWRSGTTSAHDAAAALDRFEVSLLAAQTAIDNRAPLAEAPRAVVDLRLTADLYLAAVRVARVATAQPDGALQDQLVLQFSRLRNLGDRAFDQANAELEPLLGAPREVEGVTIVRAPEVPDWVDMKLAAGPPLATPPSPVGTPRVYQSIRPTESAQDWIAHVRTLGIPSSAEQAAALRSGSVPQLGQLATLLTSASNDLFGSPDPRGERLIATRVQLGLLIDAEAARAAEASRLIKRTRLPAIAEALAAAGDLLWDTRLG
jgi:hypothetical protein